MPLEQSWQCAWLALLKLRCPKRPAWHSVHLLFQLMGPLFQLPSAQATHEPDDSRPQPLRMVPLRHALQVLHDDCPVLCWNLPSAQLVHLHIPSASVILPLSHSAHLVFHKPAAALNLPATQAGHVPPLDAPQLLRK